MSNSLITLKIMKEGGGDDGYLMEFGEMTLIAHLPPLLAQEVQEVLEEFKEICEEKRKLPPNRFKDYAIQIKPGEKPPNLRPYCYLHSQKNEIEKLVNEMLLTRIMRPSCNPYSSLVLLLKKKDNT